MSKVARADYAASVPWLGITGKPAGVGDPVDIGSLKAAGFSNGQVARWNGTKFVPYTIPAAPVPPVVPPSTLPAQIQFNWDVPSILPLQSAYEDFALLGAIPGEVIAHGVSFDPGFCITQAYVITNDSIRLKVVNLDSVAVDLPASVWNIQRF